MTAIILHHYPLSPFAEKIRRLLAYKRIRRRSVEQPMMAPKPERTALTAWYGRIDAFGTGSSRPMAPAEALAIACEAAPVDVGGPSVADPTLAGGDVVGIVADDFGREESRGTVARLTADEITIRRQDRALGEIAVHFPRSGYRIVRS